MSAAEAIRMAMVTGIRFGVEGADLTLEADHEPPVGVVKEIKRHRTEIIELLGSTRDGWTP